MSPVIRKITTTATIALTLILGSFTCHAQASEHTLKLENNSNFDIYEVHLSSASSNNWGPDLLRRQVLSSGEVFSMFDINDDEDDMKLVDEDGDSCIRRISIYSNRTWSITNDRLIGCELHQLSR